MSWDGIPASKRLCAGCGAKLTLAHDMPLWFEGDSLVWHFACKLAALRAELLAVSAALDKLVEV